MMAFECFLFLSSRSMTKSQRFGRHPRHGPARPGHLHQHLAVIGGPDEPHTRKDKVGRENGLSLSRHSPARPGYPVRYSDTVTSRTKAPRISIVAARLDKITYEGGVPDRVARSSRAMTWRESFPGTSPILMPMRTSRAMTIRARVNGKDGWHKRAMNS